MIAPGAPEIRDLFLGRRPGFHRRWRVVTHKDDVFVADLVADNIEAALEQCHQRWPNHEWRRHYSASPQPLDCEASGFYHAPKL